MGADAMNCKTQASLSLETVHYMMKKFEHIRGPIEIDNVKG